MKILVTGSNGLLGQKLSKLLQTDENVHLIATARGKSVLKITKGEYHSMDICDKDQVSSVIAQTQPDVVIHTAAMTNVDQCETDREGCWGVNVDAVKHVIEACQKNNARLIHLSTDFIFDGSHGPLDENEPAKPVNYYGESKLAAEELVKKSSTPWAILRTVLVYGITRDMSRSNIVLWVKSSLEQGKKINVVNDQFRTPTLAEDLAVGCYLAATKNAEGIYNISGKDFLSPYEIAIHTARFFELDETLINKADSTTFKQPAKRPLITGFNIEKARKELGYEPHSFIQGIGVIAKQLEAPELA
jgi:dTDP-4-dehydrorhamnose reductase